MISVHTSVKFAKNDEIACTGHGRNVFILILVESVIQLVKVIHDGGVRTDQYGKLVLRERTGDRLE